MPKSWERVSKNEISHYMSEENQETKNYHIVPVLLCLVMIVSGILMALKGDNQNQMQRFCFAILISLGAGLGATYLTGAISGVGKFGFINVRSVTGGFAVWVITLGTFFYFYPMANKIVPTMAGKWLYVCSGHDGKYQHGGRFIATQEGDVWYLNGERMWKDTLDTSGTWNCMKYAPTKSWNSTFAYIDKDHVIFEYVIPNVNGEDIHGFVSGKAIIENKEAVKVKGTFNQVFPSKQISGDIEFFRVEDSIFNVPNWDKNHECEK